MKKKLLVGLILIFSFLSPHAQILYSKENLEKMSVLELNQYLKKAEAKKRTGIAMLICGPIATVAGVLVMERNFVQGSAREHGNTGSANGFMAGALLFVGGVGTTLVSVPKVVTNSLRTQRIKNIILHRPSIEFNVSPGVGFNNTSQKFSAGVILSVRF